MLSVPPPSPQSLTPGSVIAERLKPLVGTKVSLAGQNRTYGTNVRKLVTQCLEKYCDEDESCSDSATCAKKGVPKIKRELVDTYAVTKGATFNLQVWNRITNSSAPLIEYDNGERLTCKDVRFAFVRIDTETNIVRSIVVTTPEYIENAFGAFGKPTVKWQLVIGDKKRKEIVSGKPPVLIEPDFNLDQYLNDDITCHSVDMFDDPKKGEVASIEALEPVVVDNLLGKVIDPAETKNRAQTLEYSVISLLNYDIDEDGRLAGGYPDLPNQAIEIKIQDSPTVDLGKHTPRIDVEVYADSGITTESIRYLIALMNPATNEIEGIVLVPGKSLEKHFSYVADQSYKCQRWIPMSFFDEYEGQSVYLE